MGDFHFSSPADIADENFNTEYHIDDLDINPQRTTHCLTQHDPGWIITSCPIFY